MLGRQEPFLERSVHYNNLTPAAIAELTTLARRRGQQVLQELNARALQLQQRDSGTPQASQRINFGVYLFGEDEAAGSEPPSDDHASTPEPSPRRRARRHKSEK